MAKEKVEHCPVFRCRCIEDQCEAFQRQVVETTVDKKASKKGTKKRGRKPKEKTKQETVKYCTFFKLEIK